MLVDQDVYERVTADRIQAYENASRRQAVNLDRKVLERYAGRYAGPEGVVTIRADQDGLDVSIPGRGSLKFRPSDERTFFVEGIPITLEFVTEGGHEVDRAILRAGNESIDLVKMKQ